MQAVFEQIAAGIDAEVVDELDLLVYDVVLSLSKGGTIGGCAPVPHFGFDVLDQAEIERAAFAGAGCAVDADLVRRVGTDGTVRSERTFDTGAVVRVVVETNGGGYGVAYRLQAIATVIKP